MTSVAHEETLARQEEEWLNRNTFLCRRLQARIKPGQCVVMRKAEHPSCITCQQDGLKDLGQAEPVMPRQLNVVKDTEKGEFMKHPICIETGCTKFQVKNKRCTLHNKAFLAAAETGIQFPPPPAASGALDIAAVRGEVIERLILDGFKGINARSLGAAAEITANDSVKDVVERIKAQVANESAKSAKGEPVGAETGAATTSDAVSPAALPPPVAHKGKLLSLLEDQPTAPGFYLDFTGQEELLAKIGPVCPELNDEILILLDALMSGRLGWARPTR